MLRVDSESELVNVLSNVRKAYIYGAGMVGKLVSSRLRTVANSFNHSIVWGVF